MHTYMLDGLASTFAVCRGSNAGSQSRGHCQPGIAAFDVSDWELLLSAGISYV